MHITHNNGNLDNLDEASVAKWLDYLSFTSKIEGSILSKNYSCDSHPVLMQKKHKPIVVGFLRPPRFPPTGKNDTVSIGNTGPQQLANAVVVGKFINNKNNNS